MKVRATRLLRSLDGFEGLDEGVLNVLLIEMLEGRIRDNEKDGIDERHMSGLCSERT